MIDQSLIEEARTELLQASTELDEAANIVEGRSLPSVASIFRTAAKKKREVAANLFPSLEGK